MLFLPREACLSSPKVTLENILAEVQHLSPHDRLQLIKSVADMLVPDKSPIAPRPLAYGEFHGAVMSTEKDFRIAEWRPTERDLNGA